MIDLIEFLKAEGEARPGSTIAVVSHWGVIYSLTGRSLDNCAFVDMTTESLPSTPFDLPEE